MRLFILSGIDGICRVSGLHYQWQLVAMVTKGLAFNLMSLRSCVRGSCPQVRLAFTEFISLTWFILLCLMEVSSDGNVYLGKL